ncbi:MAG: FtsX-like permease family protein [Phycisphaerales bacterium]|nr:FtsX-like permease family protein [Phycisphaerales bacterium]
MLVGTAALTGALLVGDSMRGSLRDRALARVGPVDLAMRSPRFVRGDLADKLETAMSSQPAQAGRYGACGLIEMLGGVEQADTRRRANDVRLFGVDASLNRLFDDADAVTGVSRDGIVLNKVTAEAIGAKAGDDVLVRVAAAGPIPSESLLGRPDAQTISLRLRVERVVDATGVGGFSLDVSQMAPMDAFVSRERLANAIGVAGRINTVLFGGADLDRSTRANEIRNRLQADLKTLVGFDDYGIRLREDADRGLLAISSDRLLLEPAVESAMDTAAKKLGATASGALTYLANSIDLLDDAGEPMDGRRVPYSIVCGLDVEKHARLVGGPDVGAIGDDDVVLNEWTATDLGARVGDRISMEYYVAGRFGALETRRHSFRVAAIVPMEGWVVDRDLMPPFPGIAEADTLASWDPPPSYKIDLSRIRDKDEDYWRDWRGAPKAFVSLATAQRLWAGDEARFGDVTSIYVRKANESPSELATTFQNATLAALPPDRMGLRVATVKEDALKAGAGSTDFSGLFIAFSFFVIFAAAILVTLSFRLATERRAGQVGLLMAVGFGPRDVRRVFMGEGAIVAGTGAIVGAPVGVGYAWLMLAGLRTWWRDAVNAPFLTLHVTTLSVAIGVVGGFLVAMLSIRLALRGLMRKSPRSLLAGAIQSDNADEPGRRRWAIAIFVVSLVGGLGASLAALFSENVPRVPAFFGAGGGLLVAGLAAMAMWLGGSSAGRVIRPGGGAMWRLGLRNARRERSRSVLTTSLIACATFVVVAVGANRHRAGEDAFAKDAGTGGYRLIATSSTPVAFDLNSPEGREQLSLSDETTTLLDGCEAMALRRMRGDDSSCLNLYQVRRPEILGAPRAWIERGGFAFAQSAATTTAERENPWTLLERDDGDDVIPAIGDMNTLMWLLKLGIGDDLPIVDERGRDVKLRIVGMLSGSILQSQLIVSEDRFVEMFPDVSGYGMFLFAPKDSNAAGVTSDRIDALSEKLEYDLSSYAFDAESSLDVLNRFRAIENTYMSAFQALGGLGLAIGTIGLAVVMLRNIVERRRELALLRALGYSRRMLGTMALAENVALLFIGLSIGTIAALIAAGPNIVSTGALVDWQGLAATLGVVAIVGLASGVWAVRAAVRAPLISALRSE